MALKKLPGYEEINGGAHRKPASILGAPSIVRHLAFWDVHPEEAVEMKIAAPAKAQSPAVEVERAAERGDEGEVAAAYQRGGGYKSPQELWRERWKKRWVNRLGSGEPEKPDPTTFPEEDRVYGFERPAYQPDDHQQLRRRKYLAYLRKLNRVLKRCADLNHVDATPAIRRSQNEVGRNSADIFTFWWCGLRMTIRLEMESEYVTLTSIIDLSAKAPAEISGAAGKNQYVARLKRSLVALEKVFNAKNETRPDSYWRTLRHRLQNEIWQEVDNCLIDPKGKMAASLGYVFADFRGLITGAMSDPNSQERSKKEDHRFRSPFLSPEPVGSIQRPRKPVPADSWRRDALDRLWPLIKSEHDSSNFEFTASGYLDGRAVFVSALGPQSTTTLKKGKGAQSQDDWTPLHYYLHTDSYDEWQLGRLINRLHNVATLRLAAIVRIGDLIEAGEIAEQVAQLIEKADDAIRDALALVSCARPTDPRKRAEYDAKMAEPALAIADAERQLARINQMFPLDITARLERSRHYIERFMTGADVFRARRIEGFQLYKEFVSRRMNGLFSYIDLLHRRMDDIWAGMSELHRKQANLKMATVNCEIQSLTSEIKAVTQTIKDEDGKIKKIQDFGEVALIGILLPYYLGSILYHALEHEAPTFIPYLWGLMAFTGAVVAILTINAQVRDDAREAAIVDAEYQRKRYNFRWLFIALAVVSLLFLFWITWKSAEGVEHHPNPACEEACLKD